MKKQFINTVERGLSLCMAAALTLMAVSIFTNVILRYGFNSGITWSEEISRYLFVFMIFAGAALASLRNEHLQVDAFINLLPAPIAKLAQIVAQLLILFACYLMIEGGWSMLQINLNSVGPVTGMPLWLLYFAAILMTAVMALVALVNLYGLCTSSNNKEAQ